MENHSVGTHFGVSAHSKEEGQWPQSEINRSSQRQGQPLVHVSAQEAVLRGGGGGLRSPLTPRHSRGPEWGLVSQKTACAIDSVVGGSLSLSSQAEKECRSNLIFHIEF